MKNDLTEGLAEKYGESYIPESWGIDYNTDHYFKLQANATSSVSLSKDNINNDNTNIYYNLSRDESGWQKLTTSGVELNEGEYI
jgi:hypothetical protein